MTITQFQLNAFQWEYNTLLTVVQPGADILDRIGYLEQTFDMVDLGEIEVTHTSGRVSWIKQEAV